MVPFLIGLVVVAFLVVFAVTVRGLTRMVRERGRREIARAFPDGGMLKAEPMASTLGLTSLGAMQARGNGALVLTAREIWFGQLVPARERRIALDAVIEVSLVRSHLGKSLARDLLHVKFRVDAGEDSEAWYVPDPAAWRDAIDAAR